MSTPMEAAFEKVWLDQDDWHEYSERCCGLHFFELGVSHAAKANTELIKEYQETMEKKGEE